jgi:hypothetical protein
MIQSQVLRRIKPKAKRKFSKTPAEIFGVCVCLLSFRVKSFSIQEAIINFRRHVGFLDTGVKELSQRIRSQAWLPFVEDTLAFWQILRSLKLKMAISRQNGIPASANCFLRQRPTQAIIRDSRWYITKIKCVNFISLLEYFKVTVAHVYLMYMVRLTCSKFSCEMCATVFTSLARLCETGPSQKEENHFEIRES